MRVWAPNIFNNSCGDFRRAYKYGFWDMADEGSITFKENKNVFRIPKQMDRNCKELLAAVLNKRNRLIALLEKKVTFSLSSTHANRERQTPQRILALHTCVRHSLACTQLHRWLRWLRRVVISTRLSTNQCTSLAIVRWTLLKQTVNFKGILKFSLVAEGSLLLWTTI